MIDPRVYLELEAQLLRRLRASWRPLAAKIAGGISEAIRAGDYAAAYDLAREIDLTEVATKNKQYVKYLLLACANFGARMVSNAKHTFVSSVGSDDFLDRIADNFCKSVAINCTTQMYKRAVQLIAQAEQEATTQKAEKKVRYVKEFVDFTKNGDAQLQLTSALHTSRLAVWGFTAEADVLDITEYRLSAVLDGRTSDFCRAINGKTFRVADAHKSINAILSVQNPDDVKTLQPWPKQDKASLEEYAKMDSAQLTAAGLHIPPFHPNCRTLLVRVGEELRPSKPVKEKPKPVDAPVDTPTMPETTSTVETFKELGLEVTEDQVKHWNDSVGLSPVLTLAKLAGFTPKEVLDGILGKLYKTIDISDNGDIKFKYRRKLTTSATSKAKVNSQMTYDPFTGRMHLDYLEFRKAEPKEAAAFLVEAVGNAKEISKSVGAEALTLTAGGKNGAYTFGRMGLLPSAGEWYDLKEALLLKFLDGDFALVEKTLTKKQLGLVMELLNSKEPEALKVLTHLPFRVNGQPVGKVLLKDTTYTATMEL